MTDQFAGDVHIGNFVDGRGEGLLDSFHRKLQSVSFDEVNTDFPRGKGRIVVRSAILCEGKPQLFELVGAADRLGTVSCLLQSRQEHSGKNGNDGNNY